jgi:chromate transporter
MIYLQLFYVFFKVGLFGFGGGYAILSLIYQDIQMFDTFTADDFSNLVALSQVTPGPIAINAATFVGMKAAGLLGAVVATTAVSLPSFLLIMIAIAFINKFKNNKNVQYVLNGIKPATVGLMASAFIFMMKTAIWDNSDSIDWLSATSVCDNLNVIGIVIFIITYLLLKFTKIGAIKLTLLGGLLGIVFTLLVRQFDIIICQYLQRY